MASIRQRGTRYQARVIRKGHPPLVRSFPSREAAEQWASATEAALGLGVSAELLAPRRFSAAPLSASAGSPTLRQALERYGREVTPAKRGAAQEQRRIRQLQVSSIALHRLQELRSANFAQYRDERLRIVSPDTVRLELALFSHLYEIARREWGLESLVNPIKGIRKPKVPLGRTRRASQEELERILQRLSPKLSAIVTLAVETAMRRSEIVGLRWRDIDLQRRVASLAMTKNGERRLVPLSSRAVGAVRSLPLGLPEQRVFGLDTADAITRAFGNACRAAGISGLRFHDLRHEGVSRLFERGLSLPEVAAVSGHKTWAMLRRYTHLSAEKLAEKLG